MNNDLISREALKKAFLNHSCTEFEIKNRCRADENVIALIDNAPTVDTTCPHCDSGYAQGYSDGYLRGKEERPQGGQVVPDMLQGWRYEENEKGGAE